MAGKNYYVILGIDESETASGIRGAFRDLVKRYHPDRAGPEGTKQLQEIIEAYEHLSDPELRRHYNDSLRAQMRPAAVQRPQAEPLIPKRAPVFDDPDFVRPSAEALFDRIFRNFTGIGAPKGERPEALNLELILSPGEAARGVEVPLRIPVYRRCPRCDGSGHDWLLPCPYCLETGFLEDQRTIQVRIPPMVQNGSIAELSLEHLGIHNLFLRLHIRVH